jgi:hypothetical protein
MWDIVGGIVLLLLVDLSNVSVFHLQDARSKYPDDHCFCSQRHLKVNQQPKSNNGNQQVGKNIDCISVNPESSLYVIRNDP